MSTAPTPGPAPSEPHLKPRPKPVLDFDDPLDRQSADDTDRGWGERPSAGSGDRSVGERRATSLRVRSTGAKERLMSQPTSSISTGAMPRMGSAARSASERARAWRASRSCAIWMM